MRNWQDELITKSDDINLHHSHQVPADLSHFWIVTCLSNPNRYRKLYEVYPAFEAMCRQAGVKLITVEIAFGNRRWMVTDPSNKYNVCLRSHEELWHKENMLNLGAQRAAQLDPLIREVGFYDCDMRPMVHPRHHFEEVWHGLQHHEAVQCFEYLLNLDTDGNPLGEASPSFMGSYMKHGIEQYHNRHHHKNHQPHSGAKFWMGAPGGAWAWNIEPFKAVGGLIDKCPLGSADWHMVQGLFGILEPMKKERWTPQYLAYLEHWQDRAVRWLKKDIGVIKGGMLHDNHGPKKYRYYVNRKQILVESEFVPEEDLKYDHQGLLQLETWTDRQIKLRDDIRKYFGMRMTDMPEYR